MIINKVFHPINNLRKIPIVFIPLLLFFWGIFNKFLEFERLGILSSGNLEAGFLLNNFSSYFIPFCSFIGSMVIIFRNYYIKEEELNSFSLCLTIFVIFMLMLTTRINFTSMFLGWEGVGLLSFLLIGWFSSRFWAREGAKKAVLFNRITDFFFLFFIIFEMGSPLWVFSLDSSSPSLSFFSRLIISFSFIFRVRGKSAQFLFHPWLTSAIEGPTPVRSLLHSRTMVVAGVYLLLFIQPFLFRRTLFSTSFLLIGLRSAITLIARSFWAFSQEDVKKVIALSTTSQLRLIMLIIYLNLPELAFFHMVIHGFFKALIFIRSGVSIHSGRNSQDFRNTNVSKRQKTLFNCFLIGNIGLMGFPFFGAFFRKHSLLSELEQRTCSLFLIVILFFSFSLTIGYRFKLFFFLKNSFKFSSKSSGESLITMIPLLSLVFLSLRGGILENLLGFFISPKNLILNELSKWRLIFLLFLRFFLLFLSHHNYLYSFSFSRFHTSLTFYKIKLFKSLGDWGGEKLFLLQGLKNSTRNFPTTNAEFPHHQIFRTNFFNFFSLGLIFLTFSLPLGV